MTAIVSTQRGSVMLEGLIAILVFSFGVLALVALLGVSVKDSSNAKHRTDASLLANQIIGRMWASDKTNAALVASFANPAGAEYLAWKTKVADTLPGAGNAANLPTIAIDANNQVTITVRWQLPGASGSHNYVAVTRING
jgi:type IV pilus assembly protein PilV